MYLGRKADRTSRPAANTLASAALAEINVAMHHHFHLNITSADRTASIVRLLGRLEFVLAAVPSLINFAAAAVKTWRTFGAALWTADQDAHTYLGTEGGVPDESMLSVWLNSTIKMIFRQDQADAERLASKIQGMQPYHADAITRLSRGDLVLVWESDDPNLTYNEVFEGAVIPDDMELRAFRGS